MSRRASHGAVTASLIVSALVLSLGLGACSKTETAATLMSDAQQYETKGDNKAALIQLKNAASKAPEDGEVRMRLANLYLKVGDAVSAEKEVRKAGELKIDSARTTPVLARALVLQGQGQKALELTTNAPLAKNAALLALRGDAYLSLNDLDKARQSYEEALAINPTEPQGLLGMARVAALGKDFDGAGQLTEKAISANPKDADAFMMKGNLLRAKGKNEEAAAAYGQAIAAKPDMSTAYLERANAYMVLKKFDLAKADIEAARKAAPNTLPPLYAQAVLDFSQNNYTAANDAIQKVLSKAPDHQPSILLAGAVELNLGSYKIAEQHLSAYLNNNPGNVYARKLLAQTQLRSAQPGSAGATLAPILAKGGNDAQIMALAGESSLRAQDFAKATQYFEKATALEPQAAGLRTSLGLSMLAEGKQEQGVSELEKATALDPKSEQAGVALVRTELALKHYDKALAAAKALTAAHPDNAELHNLVGGANLAKGDKAAARASFEKAASLKPDLFSPVLNLAKLDVADKQPDAAKARLVAFNDKAKSSAALKALSALAMSQGKTEEATTWLEKAIAEHPEDLGATSQLVNLYLSTKQAPKALTLARKVQAANPSKPELLDMLGQAQVASNDMDGALESYSKLGGLLPKSAEAQLRIAAIHLRLKNPSAAGDDLKKALSIDPRNEKALLGQIELAAAANKTDEALALARTMQKTLPKSPIGYIVEGDLLTTQKKFDLALRAYEQGDALAKSSNSMLKVASGLRNAGKAKDSESRVTAWLAAHPGDPGPTIYLGELLLARKDFKGASQRFESLLPAAPNDPVLLNNLAWSYQQLKDPRALPTAERALKAAPESAAVLDTVGWLLAEQGNTARALPLLQKAVLLQPEARDLRYHLAATLAKSGDKRSAKAELDRVLADAKPFPQIDEAKALLKTL